MNKITRFLSAHVLTLFLLLFPLSLLAQQLQVHFIDVGQGDAILITNPPNQTVLIDAGDKPAGKTVVNYLRQHDINKIDILIATHPDNDHIGGMAKVIEKIPIALYLDSGVEKPTQTCRNLDLLIKDKGIRHQIARAGQDYDLGDGVNLRIFFPSEPLVNKPKQGTVWNANSTVAKLTYKNVSFLLSGDAEEATENRLLREQKKGALSAIVLKVAHHGSGYTTTQRFLDAVNPKIAVISVGEGNRYGHPSDETLKRLKDKGVTVYRTDYDSNIIIKTDGNTLEVVIQKRQKETESIKPRAPPSRGDSALFRRPALHKPIRCLSSVYPPTRVIPSYRELYRIGWQHGTNMAQEKLEGIPCPHHPGTIIFPPNQYNTVKYS